MTDAPGGIGLVRPSTSAFGRLAAACGLAILAGCAGADIRPDRPIPLTGQIESIASCTLQRLTAAGYDRPGLTFRPVTGQPRLYIEYRETAGGTGGASIGVRPFTILLEQRSPGRAQARITQGVTTSVALRETALGALQACQGG